MWTFQPPNMSSHERYQVGGQWEAALHEAGGRDLGLDLHLTEAVIRDRGPMGRRSRRPPGEPTPIGRGHKVGERERRSRPSVIPQFFGSARRGTDAILRETVEVEECGLAVMADRPDEPRLTPSGPDRLEWRS